MLSLSYIQGIDDDAVELLKTVGVEDATLLSQFTPQTLATLLRSKNGADALPSHQVLEDWISQAELISSTLSGGGEEPEADSDVEVVEAVELDEEDIADAEVAELAEEDDFDDIPEVVVLEEDDEAGGIHVVELPNKPYHKDEELAYWR